MQAAIEMLDRTPGCSKIVRVIASREGAPRTVVTTQEQLRAQRWLIKRLPRLVQRSEMTRDQAIGLLVAIGITHADASCAIDAACDKQVVDDLLRDIRGET
jgi:hypothetical protein